MKVIVAVALGGALGAVGRYLVVTGFAAWLGLGFPYGTLTVNVVGSFVMGVLVEVSAQNWTPAPEVRAFFMIGLLGAFTTFSAFSSDVIALYTRGAVLAAGAYVALSLVLTIGGLALGIAVARWGGG
jgi:CrcB protein